MFAVLPPIAANLTDRMFKGQDKCESNEMLSWGSRVVLRMLVVKVAAPNFLAIFSVLDRVSARLAQKWKYAWTTRLEVLTSDYRRKMIPTEIRNF